MLDTIITRFTTMTTGKVAETILYLHFIQCVVFHREFSSSFYDEKLHSPQQVLGMYEDKERRTHQVKSNLSLTKTL